MIRKRLSKRNAAIILTGVLTVAMTTAVMAAPEGPGGHGEGGEGGGLYRDGGSRYRHEPIQREKTEETEAAENTGTGIRNGAGRSGITYERDIHGAASAAR